MEKVQRRRPVKARKRGAGKARVLSVIVHRGQVEVRQVAPAVAGGEQLAPDARLPFKNGDGIPFILRGGKRGHQPAGPAAENQNLHVLLLGVRGMEYVQFLYLNGIEFAAVFRKRRCLLRADRVVRPYKCSWSCYCIRCSSAARRRLVQKISMACSSSSTGGRDGAMRMLESCGSRP